MARYVVARAGEIAEGGRKMVRVRGREVGVFRHQGEYFALLNRCPHQGAELCKGRLVGLATSPGPGQFELSRQGEMLRCPWHGWEYDLRTGQSWCDPEDTKARAFEVKVEPGESLVKGPYIAETFEVTVDGDYVVIEA